MAALEYAPTTARTISPDFDASGSGGGVMFHANNGVNAAHGPHTIPAFHVHAGVRNSNPNANSDNNNGGTRVSGATNFARATCTAPRTSDRPQQYDGNHSKLNTTATVKNCTNTVKSVGYRRRKLLFSIPPRPASTTMAIVAGSDTDKAPSHTIQPAGYAPTRSANVCVATQANCPPNFGSKG